MTKRSIIIIVLLLVVILPISAQQFFKPVRSDLFSDITADSRAKGNSIWMFRPAITLTAAQWTWKDNTFVAGTFQSAGLGVGYQHFKPTSDTDLSPYNDWGANALLLLGTDVSAAVTVSGLGLINIGVLYNFSQGGFGVLMGVQLRF